MVPQCKVIVVSKQKVKSQIRFFLVSEGKKVHERIVLGHEHTNHVCERDDAAQHIVLCDVDAMQFVSNNQRDKFGKRALLRDHHLACIRMLVQPPTNCVVEQCEQVLMNWKARNSV